MKNLDVDKVKTGQKIRMALYLTVWGKQGTMNSKDFCLQTEENRRRIV